ncbi:MAG: type II toxin-antitoxin system HicB family antitoxin [Treponema sp.]|jgi:predicted RNase H-like HicB family nuclease|nr:type II toxin-antitoxin system HicB family antitoxin [Treponema sp.]
MQIKYTYKQDGKFLIGHIDEYPEYPTQAFSIEELEANLQDIYEMINDGTLEIHNKHGVMEMTV